MKRRRTEKMIGEDAIVRDMNEDDEFDEEDWCVSVFIGTNLGFLCVSVG